MINRYGLIPLAFVLFVFVIFFISLFPSPHKTFIDQNLLILEKLDNEKYSEKEIKKLGLSIGTGCNEDYSFRLTAN